MPFLYNSRKFDVTNFISPFYRTLNIKTTTLNGETTKIQSAEFRYLTLTFKIQ